MSISITGAQIRDLGRVLPWMASLPPDQPQRLTHVLTRETSTSMSAPKRWAVIETVIQACEQRRASVEAAVEKLAAEFQGAKDAGVEGLMDALADPTGEGTDSCENAEAYFRAEQTELSALRDTLVEAGGLDVYDAKVFVAIDALHTVFGLAVSCMQQARWLILMVEGGRDAPSSDRTYSSGAALIAAIEAEGADAQDEAV